MPSKKLLLNPDYLNIAVIHNSAKVQIAYINMQSWTSMWLRIRKQPQRLNMTCPN